MTDFNQKYSEALTNPVHFEDYEPTFNEQAGILSNTITGGLIINQAFKASAVFGSAAVYASQQIDNLLDEEPSSTTRFLQNQLSATIRKSMMMEEEAQNAGATTGIVYSISDMLGTFALGGTAFKSIEGISAAAGGLQGLADYEKGLEQGLDKKTAAEKAAVTGVTTALGGLIPLTAGVKLTPAARLIAETGNRWAKAGVYGKLLAEDISFTAGSNVVLGMGQRGLTHEILKSNGYDVMAEQYQALDTNAMLVDGAIGILFGGIAKAAEIRSQRAVDPLFAKDNQIKQDTSSPGVAVDLASFNAHKASLNKAFEDIIQGKPVDVEHLVKDSNFAVKEDVNWTELLTEAITNHYPNDSFYYTRDGIPIPGSIYNDIVSSLESETTPLLKTADRKKLNTEIQELNRQINELTRQRLDLINEKAKGKGKELSRNKKEKQVTLNNLNNTERNLRSEVALKKATLERSSRGGTAFEAKADLTRLSQGIVPSRFAKMIGERIGSTFDGSSNFLKVNNDIKSDVVSNSEFGNMKKNAVSEEITLANTLDKIVTEKPDMTIPFVDESGIETTMKASELMDSVRKEVEQARSDKRLYDAAVACLLRKNP